MDYVLAIKSPINSQAATLAFQMAEALLAKGHSAGVLFSRRRKPRQCFGFSCQ